MLALNKAVKALNECTTATEKVMVFKKGAEALFEAFRSSGLCGHMDLRLFVAGEIGETLGGVELTWPEAEGDDPNVITWLVDDEGIAVVEGGVECLYYDPSGGLFFLLGVLVHQAFGPPN